MKPVLKLIYFSLILTVYACIGACTPQTSIYDQKQAEDQWLQQNLKNPDLQQLEKPAIKTEYFNEILAGKLVVGMTLQDVMAATQREPFGRNKYPLIFWCDQTITNQCDASCTICSAVMLMQSEMHLLRGRGTALNLEKTMQTTSTDSAENLRQKNLDVIIGLFTNQVAPGMSASDFERIRFPPDVRYRYFCNNVQSFFNCLRQCARCQIDIIELQNGRYLIQSIVLNGLYDFQSVSHINTHVEDTLQ